MSRSDKPVVVVVPGDLHLAAPDRENVRVAHRAIDEANSLVRPDFVQFIGDNVQDATEEQFRLFDELRARLAPPHFALVGDHDVDEQGTIAAFRRHVGGPRGAHVQHGFRFVRLNTQEARPLGLSSEQIAWFSAELDAAEANDERVVVFQHNYPYQIWETFEGPGVDAWRALARSRRVAAIVCGHTHYWQVANDGRNVLVAVRSIGDPEGGPPGYAVLYFRGEDLAATYRPVGEAGPLVLLTHPRERLLATAPAHVVRGEVQIIARAWSASSSLVAVRCRIDQGPWRELLRAPDDDGHWFAPLDGGRLSKGEHDLEAVAIDDEGMEGRHALRFMVDPTGRYTAVPEARPRVASTAFC